MKDHKYEQLELILCFVTIFRFEKKLFICNEEIDEIDAISNS